VRLALGLLFLLLSTSFYAAEFIGSSGARYFFNMGDDVYMCWSIDLDGPKVSCVGKNKQLNIGIKYVCTAVPLAEGAFTDCIVDDINTLSA